MECVTDVRHFAPVDGHNIPMKCQQNHYYTIQKPPKQNQN